MKDKGACWCGWMKVTKYLFVVIPVLRQGGWYLSPEVDLATLRRASTHNSVVAR